MDFICYLQPGWAPLIRPAEASRAWMDATPEAFAYRCLPLSVANAHGWEILAPSDAVAYWTGGGNTEDVVVRAEGDGAPVSLFGQGVLTFHVQGLFRTPPGWDLWVGGSPNQCKGGIAPLTGLVETDWSPYSFTMNWKFTRRNHWVRFRQGEPICFVFPVERGGVERMAPKFVGLDENAGLAGQFAEWSRSRDAFQATMADGRTRAPADKWQKRYYRGLAMGDETPVAGHRSRIRLRPFVHAPPAEAEAAGVDTMWLADLLRAVASRLADGGTLLDALRDAGVAEAAARRIAEAVAQAGRERPGLCPGPAEA